MRLGVLGGTFDPLHNGHLSIAQSALKQLNLDKLLFVPAFVAPHKQLQKPAASPHHRHQMLAIASQSDERMDVCTFEIEKARTSYTIDTVNYLKSIYPKSEIYLLMGADSWNSFNTWKDFEKILVLAKLAVVKRPGLELKTTPGISKIDVVMDEVDISASELRKSLAQGKYAELNIPQGVLEYIEQHNLYRA